MDTPLGQALLAWQLVIHGLAVSGGRRHVGAGATSLSLLFSFPGSEKWFQKPGRRMWGRLGCGVAWIA